ncbi:MAG: lactam utilization protein LamB [Bacteroidetes bacterium]|nr:MAG: lactam utilization protein LamB [Bacteroidota bacterium]
MFQTIDINVDVGEGVNNEALIMPYISSCNIACGGHTGELQSMRAVIKLAKQYNVKIGAHPSFPDKENFGRQKINISYSGLYKSIREQINSLMLVLREEHARLYHIKPHGALYNLAVIDKSIATVIIEAIKSISLPVKLYVPYKSVIAEIAINDNIPIVYEAFADRNYNDDLTLVSRNEKNAIISDSEELFNHVLRMIMHQKVKTINGVELKLKAKTFCIHGDNPKAVNLIRDLKEKLEQVHINIE